MVADYVEIIVGVRVTDRYACTKICGMSDEKYDEYIEDSYGRVFTNCCLQIPYEWGLNAYTSICCSDTTDVIIGYAIKRYYRIFNKCDDCLNQGYGVCNRCFSMTEGGLIDFRDTYPFQNGPTIASICDMCKSYNPEQGGSCVSCKYPFQPVYSLHVSEHIDRNIPRELFWYWNDCCSCT